MKNNLNPRLNRRRAYRIPCQQLICVSWDNKTTTGIIQDTSIQGFSAGINSDISIGDIVKVSIGNAYISEIQRNAVVVRQISDHHYAFEFVDEEPKPSTVDKEYLRPFIRVIDRKRKELSEESELNEALNKLDQLRKLRQKKASERMSRKTSTRRKPLL
jgi:hypothetical protein